MKSFLTLIMVLPVALMVGCSTSRMCCDKPLTDLGPEERRFANELMANSFRDESIRNGIVAQHTIYPYHFVADTAQLNELGEHALEVLAAHYKGRFTVKKVIKHVQVFFDYDKADLRDDALPTLEEAVRILGDNIEADILITGHADARGTKEYNQKLGQRRADAVRQYMLSKGIDSGRIRILSRGELDAVAPVTDIPGMQKDRNAQFLVAEVEGYPLHLSVRRANASEELYTARKTAVVKFLRGESLDANSATIGDALPGGDGMASERVLLMLNEQSGQTWTKGEE
jgi:outer membrane protein OmpA-like peptidoglycan-associated protein